MCPVVLGKGRSLFRDNVEAIAIKLVSVTALDRGAVSLIYSQRGAAGSQADEAAARFAVRSLSARCYAPFVSNDKRRAVDGPGTAGASRLNRRHPQLPEVV
jgi:hypothetical protein